MHLWAKLEIPPVNLEVASLRAIDLAAVTSEAFAGAHFPIGQKCFTNT